MHKLLDEISNRLTIGDSIYCNSIHLLTAYNLKETADHVVKVSSIAMELANNFGVDANKAKLAGILHDIGVIIPNDKKVEIAQLLKIELYSEEKEVPSIIHQRLSKEFAKMFFDVQDDEVLNAISSHTTLRSKPSRLDMIIFLADKISWEQNGKQPFQDLIKKDLKTSLELATFNYINFLLKNEKSLQVVHPWLNEAYNELQKVPSMALSEPVDVINGY